jgi:hypothetical protein
LIYSGTQWELEWFGRQPYDADAFITQLTVNGQDYLAGLLKGMAELNPPGALTMMKLLTDGSYIVPMAASLEYEGRMRSPVSYRPKPTHLNYTGTVACGGITEHDVILSYDHGKITNLRQTNEKYRAGSLFNGHDTAKTLFELEIPVGHSLLEVLFVECPRLRVGGGAGIDTRPISIQQLLDLGMAKHS